ncbi:MAG: hypothetical protein JO021_23820 [Alphaproteobacteria bacterium]|nr:hypothetical protein [Alphaproteobacteria bacterium]
MSAPPTAPSPPALGDAAAVQAELDALAQEIELGLSLAGQQKMLDLANFDARVEAVCRAAQALPPAEAQVLVEQLGTLVTLLDRLAAELVHHFGNLPPEVESPSPRVAADAYGKGPGGRTG